MTTDTALLVTLVGETEMIALISKPFDVDDLLQAVHRAVAGQINL